MRYLKIFTQNIEIEGVKMIVDRIDMSCCKPKPNLASQPNFEGLWMRFGKYKTQMYGETKYAWAAFVPCSDGVKLTNKIDPVKDRNLMELTPCNLTVADCKNVIGALQGKEDNTAYKALLKLRTFINTIMTPDGHHNALFIEDKDVADVNKLKHEVKYRDVQNTINKIGKKLGFAQESEVAKKPAEFSKAEPLKFPEDPAELAEYLRLNGIA